jgi:hypothetical protein
MESPSYAQAVMEALQGNTVVISLDFLSCGKLKLAALFEWMKGEQCSLQHLHLPYCEISHEDIVEFPRSLPKALVTLNLRGVRMLPAQRNELRKAVIVHRRLESCTIDNLNPADGHMVMSALLRNANATRARQANAHARVKLMKPSVEPTTTDAAKLSAHDSDALLGRALRAEAERSQLQQNVADLKVCTCVLVRGMFL